MGSGPEASPISRFDINMLQKIVFCLLFALALLSQQANATIVIKQDRSVEGSTNDLWTLELRGAELLYRGRLDPEGVDAVIALYNSLDTKPTTLAIRSTGGSSGSGITLGEFVHSHAMTVRVVDYCGSSCANYVFTAAPRKILSKRAIVWWHGAVRSSLFDIPGTKETYRCKSEDTCGQEMAIVMKEKYRCQSTDTCERELAAVSQYFPTEFEALRNRERAFFNKIDVDSIVAVYGQEIVDCKCNWTFSIEDMKAFHVTNVSDEDSAKKVDFSEEERQLMKEIRRKVVKLRVQKAPRK
jgi:hypothetical protein